MQTSPGQKEASEIVPICMSSSLNNARLMFFNAHTCSYIYVNGFHTCAHFICLPLPFIVGQSSDHRSSFFASPRVQDAIFAHRPRDVAAEQHCQCATEVKGCPRGGMISPSYQMRGRPGALEGWRQGGE